LRELEKIWNKNEKCNTEVDSTEDDFGDYTWVYTRKVPYLLGDNRNMNKEMKDKNVMKKENSINPYNLGETKVNSEVLVNY